MCTSKGRPSAPPASPRSASAWWPRRAGWGAGSEGRGGTHQSVDGRPHAETTGLDELHAEPPPQKGTTCGRSAACLIANPCRPRSKTPAVTLDREGGPSVCRAPTRHYSMSFRSRRCPRPTADSGRDDANARCERDVHFLYSHTDFDLASAPIPASVFLILHRGQAGRTRANAARSAAGDVPRRATRCWRRNSMLMNGGSRQRTVMTVWKSVPRPVTGTRRHRGPAWHVA